jgi:L-threonylcarbamoyladenylate synthase
MSIILNTLNDSTLIAAIKAGQVGVLPTDTIYGLVAAAADPAAATRLYALKHREHKPGTVIAASVEQIVSLGAKARYLKPVEHYWPNPISVEIPFNLVHLNQETGHLAFRIPADADLRAFLGQTGPLLTTSVNHPGEKPASTLAEAQAYFGDKVDFYVDGGDLSGRPPSTVMRVVDDAIEVLREGAVKINDAGEIVS